MAKIIENREMRNKNYVFKDRSHAGEVLARQLGPMHFADPMILVIPSGGVPVGAVIAEKLGIPMDLVIVRKLQVPYNPEAGFGSMSPDGDVIVNRKLADQLGLNDTEIESAINRVKRELDRRVQKFRGKKPFPDLKGKSAILVDDGLASGYTMLSAINSIRKYSPGRVAVAVPTASRNAIELVSPHADCIFCPNIRDTALFAVADAYQEWHDLDDREVIGILKGIF